MWRTYTDRKLNMHDNLKFCTDSKYCNTAHARGTLNGPIPGSPTHSCFLDNAGCQDIMGTISACLERACYVAHIRPRLVCAQSEVCSTSVVEERFPCLAGSIYKCRTIFDINWSLCSTTQVLKHQRLWRQQCAWQTREVVPAMPSKSRDSPPVSLI